MEITPYTRKAHYYETDQMGIVHHSNYIRWFEESRVELMDQVGFGYRRMEQEGIVSPVLEIRCAFRSMVRFGDEIRILPAIRSISGAKLTVVYRVEDAATGELRAEGESRHCFLREGRPVSLKRECRAFYDRMVELVEDAACNT